MQRNTLVRRGTANEDLRGADISGLTLKMLCLQNKTTSEAFTTFFSVWTLVDGLLVHLLTLQVLELLLFGVH